MRLYSLIPLVLALVCGCDARRLFSTGNDLTTQIPQPESPASGAPTAPESTSPAPDAPEEFVEGVRHAFLALIHGRTLVFEGTADGEHRRDVVRTLPDTRNVLGVDCTEVYQEVFLDGELAEVTSEWYAEDEDGNLWRFGEESYEVEEGELVLTADSWIAGVDGAEQWVLFSANPVVGDQFSGFVPDGEEIYLITSISETAVVPAGVFENCMQAVENPDDPEDSDIILYAEGVGMVREESSSGMIELVSIADE